MSGWNEARWEIGELANRIHAIADLLTLLEDLDESDPGIKPRSIARAGNIIKQDIQQINVILDGQAFSE